MHRWKSYYSRVDSLLNNIYPKRSRFGIKTYILCDCKTGYILDTIIYTGSESYVAEDVEEIGKTGNIVLTLLKPYLGKGHTLYVDNYYSSPALFNFLHANITNACGTVRQRRKGMPIMDKKLKKGEIDFRTSSNMLALKWRDKRDVFMLSTFHNSEFICTGKKNYKTQEFIRKPKCIVTSDDRRFPSVVIVHAHAHTHTHKH